MKKSVKKMILSRETVKNLGLKPGAVAGGYSDSCESCHLDNTTCVNQESTIGLFTRCFC